MRVEFDVYEFMKRMIPAHKRQTNRLALFWWSIAQINLLWESFREWRKEMIYESNVTGQTLSLVDLLNRRVNGANGGISIVERTDEGIYLSVLNEDADHAEMSLISENTDFEYVSKAGEGGASLDIDFKVVVPVGVNFDEVKKIVDRYVIAGYQYEVVNSI